MDIGHYYSSKCGRRGRGKTIIYNIVGYYCEHNLTLVVILVRLEPSPELRVGGRVPAAAAVHVGHTGVRGAGWKRA